MEFRIFIERKRARFIERYVVLSGRNYFYLTCARERFPVKQKAFALSKGPMDPLYGAHIKGIPPFDAA